MRRAAMLTLAVGVLVGVSAPPAAAHAQLVETDPQAGGVYDEPPESVTLTYSEPVEVSFGAVRVYDHRGESLEAGRPGHPGGDASRVRVDLPDLGDGSYVVTWRVASADAHSVQGAFTFQVGPEATGADLDDLAQRLLTDQGGSPVVGATYSVARFVVFASLAVLVGGAAFLVLVWPTGRGSPRATALVRAGWTGTFLATAVGLLLYGPYSAGLGLGDALDPDLLRDVLDTRFGRVWVARLVLLVVAAALLRRLLPGRAPVAEYPLSRAWLGAAGVTAAALVVTPGLAGHAGSGDLVPLAVPVDGVHVAAVTVWLGGVLMLAIALLPSKPGAAELRSAVPRYSQVALGAVGVIVATGAFQSWRQVGSLGALRDTDFGRLLVLKLLAFAALVVAAAFSREVVNRRFRAKTAARYAAAVGGRGDGDGIAGDGGEAEPQPPSDAEEVRNLRRSMMVEVVLAAAILAVTALLVNTEPGRSAESRPFLEVFEADDLAVEVRVAPARNGPNDLHITALTPEGAPTDVVEMTVQLTLPGRDIAPIDVPLERLGPGHYVSYAFNVPIDGDWRLSASALVDDTTQTAVEGDVPIR